MTVQETEETPQSIRDAIAEAVAGSDYVSDLDDGFDDLGETPSAETPAAEGEQSGTGDGQTTEQESETTEGGTDEDLPDEYWGTSLEGLSAEQKKAVIAALEQRDSTIQQLQKRLAEGQRQPEETPVQEEEPVEITDEDILRALGIDLEDQFEVEAAKKHTLPLARQLMQLEEVVDRISETEQTREVAGFWNGELDRLETEYGKLPGDRIQVLTYAANEGISDPEVLYFRVSKMQEADKRAVDEEIAKVRQTAAKKAAAGGLPPRTNAGGNRVLDTEGKSLRDTVKEAALQAQEETGFRWRDILRQGQR